MARIGILVGEGYERSELDVPRARLVEAGHEVELVGTRAGAHVHDKHRRGEVVVERAARDAHAEDYAALVIPGGRSPAHLCRDPDTVALVQAFARTGRPIAAICHGPLLLAAAGAVRGRRVTSWPAVHDELERAGAVWLDTAVVHDGPLVTSRKPADLDVFCGSLLRLVQ